jgi:hypothetical protein
MLKENVERAIWSQPDRYSLGHVPLGRPALQRFRAVLADPATRASLTALGFKI